MSDSIEVVGLDDFFDELKDLEISEAKKRRALKSYGKLMADGLDGTLPEASGKYKKGIKQEIKKLPEGLSIIIRTSAWYDIFQEYGTSKQKKNIGSFEKGVRENENEAVNAVIKELSS